MLNDIIAELETAEANLKAQVEKLFGPIASTDFSDEYAKLQDVLAKLKVYREQHLEAETPA